MNLCFVLILYNVPLPYIRSVVCIMTVWMLESPEVLWYCRSSQWTCLSWEPVFISDMASFKPTKVQFLPKLGEQVTEDTLYWKNYKVWDCITYVSKGTCFDWSSFSVFLYTDSLRSVFQSPVQIKEFGAITKIDFSPLPPHNYAVTASTRVSPFHFLSY